MLLRFAVVVVMLSVMSNNETDYKQLAGQVAVGLGRDRTVLLAYAEDDPDKQASEAALGKLRAELDALGLNVHVDRTDSGYRLRLLEAA